jgi:hypothetical protein
MSRPNFLAAALAVLLATATAAQALVPERLYFQGQLTTKDGNAVTASPDLEVRLYDGPDLGATLLWSDTFAVDVQAGAFEMFLGDNGTPLPPSIFVDNNIWLDLTVDGDLLEPRMEVVSVPYAYSAAEAELCKAAVNADMLAGLDPSAYAKADALNALQSQVATIAAGGPGGGGCVNECAAEGTTGCTAGLDAIWRCQDTEDGDACLDKVLQTNCAKGTICDLTTKQCECGLACTIGETSCASPTATGLCDDSDDDGCPTLVATECGPSEKCDGPSGACVCVNETGCNASSSTGCASNAPFKCADTDGDGCLERVMLAPCATDDVCAAGTCGCKNTCGFAGQRGCDGTKVWTCTDANGDGCLQRQAIMECGSGYFCADGRCECSNVRLSAGTCGSYDIGTQSSLCPSATRETKCGLGECSDYLGACESWRAEVLPRNAIANDRRIRFVEDASGVRARLVVFDKHLLIYRREAPGWAHTQLGFVARDAWGAVDVATQALHIFVVGDDGMVAHHDGTRWNVLKVGAKQLRAVHGFGTALVVAVGEDAQVYYRAVGAAGPWKAFSSAGTPWSTSDFNDVHASNANLVHIVGTGGALVELTIFANGAANASALPTGTTKELTAVLRLGLDVPTAALYVGGDGYYSVKQGGGTWNISPTTTGRALDVWGSGITGVWFAAGTPSGDSSPTVKFSAGAWSTDSWSASSGAVTSTGSRSEFVVFGAHAYEGPPPTTKRVELNVHPWAMQGAPIGVADELVEVHGSTNGWLFERRLSRDNLWEASQTDGTFANGTLPVAGMFSRPDQGDIVAYGTGLLAFFDGSLWHNEFTALKGSVGLSDTDSIVAYAASSDGEQMGVAAGKCFAAGVDGKWVQLPCPPGNFGSLVVSSASDAWAQTDADLFRWNGTEWLGEPSWKSVFPSSAQQVGGYGSDALWAIGNAGVFATRDAAGFTVQRIDSTVEPEPWWPHGFNHSDTNCASFNYNYYGAWSPRTWQHPGSRPTVLLNPLHRWGCTGTPPNNLDRVFVTVVQDGISYIRRVPDGLLGSYAQPYPRGISGYGERTYIWGISEGFLVSYGLEGFTQ